ncbi:MAG: protein kinase [Clostridia bacterium]|nr:protein kinase [Clostridia bacterium]
MNEKYFGNWVIVEELGSGSFGTVYKIKKEEFGNTYYSAMKVIRLPQDKDEPNRLRNEGMDDRSLSAYYAQFVKDFTNEIKVMASLQGNTNIVAYNDHKIEPNADGIGYTIYIRMEYLIPLERYLLNGGTTRNMSEKEVIKLGLDMCSALEVCEKYNIIHRDIKPDNIFISKTGDFKLGDFGIARKLEGTQSFLSKKGTYSYMAPEIYNGQTYNKTVDIYSLGLVLYKLLNHGRLPFFPPYPAQIKYSDTENAILKRMQGIAIPPIPGVNDRLNAIIQKCCAFRPQERYQSVQMLQYELQAVVRSPYAKPLSPTPIVAAGAAKTMYLKNPPAAAAAQKPAMPASGTPARHNQNPAPVKPQPPTTPPPAQNDNPNKGMMIALICTVAVVTIIAIILIVVFSSNKEENTAQQPTESVSSSTTTTLPTTTQPNTYTTEPQKKKIDNSQFGSQSSFSEVDADIRSIIQSSKADTVSFTMLDANSGDIAQYGSTDSMSASAMIVYPILFAYEQEMDTGEITKQTKIPLYTKYKGRSQLDEEKKKGPLSVEELFRYSFSYSDNIAINSLLDYIGYDTIEEVCRIAGFKSVKIERFLAEKDTNRDNTCTGKDLANMIDSMEQNRSFGYQVMKTYKCESLKDNDAKGIATVVGNNYETMNGCTGAVFNESVYIQSEKHDWIVVFLSESGEYKDGSATARKLGERLKNE